MEVYYVNHLNEKIDFGRSPYQMQIGDIFNYSNKYEGKNLAVKRIYKEISTLQTTVTIEGNSEESFFQALNDFLDITDADTVSNVSGRLYVGEYYIECNIISSDKKFWDETRRGVENNIKLLMERPVWCREFSQKFYRGSAAQRSDPFLYYPIQYPYQYSAPKDLRLFHNDHYAACDFKMIIYGPCIDPMIRINGHPYSFKLTLYEGEFLEVESRYNTVERVQKDGTRLTEFNQREKKDSVFQKIPAGNCSVIWNTSEFGFDLILYQERSEPKWTL